MSKLYVIVNTCNSSDDDGVEILSEDSDFEMNDLRWSLCYDADDNSWQDDAWYFETKEEANSSLKNVVEILNKRNPHLLQQFDYWVCEATPKTYWKLTYTFKR